MSGAHAQGGGGSHHATPPCSRVRSTLLAGSLKALRERGHGDRYKTFVDVKYQDLLFMTGAPTWFSLQVAQAHYAACDALDLPTEEMLRIGAAVAPVHTSGVDVVLRAARAGGVTPWTILQNVSRYWARMYDGSAILVAEKGPKDAQITVVGQPLARSRYWRVGLRGIMLALSGSLSQKAYVRELPGNARDAVAYSLAWV